MSYSLRTLFSAIWIISTLALFIGCSEEDDDTPTNPNPCNEYVWVILGNDSVQMWLNDLPKINVEGEEAIRLNEFVTDSLVPDYVDSDTNYYNTHGLYAYQIIGEDGFSASGNRGYPDNTWAHFNLGYMIVSSRRAIFPDDSIDLAGAYNVTGMRYIVLHRKFDLLRPADMAPDSDAFVEWNSVTSVVVTNTNGQPESALPLSAFVTQIIPNPDGLHYNMTAIDGFGPTTTMTWAQFQTGYWLLTSEKTMFTDTTLIGGRYRLRMLESIQVSL